MPGRFYFALAWLLRAWAISAWKVFKSLAPVVILSPTTKPGVPVIRSACASFPVLSNALSKAASCMSAFKRSMSSPSVFAVSMTLLSSTRPRS